ncbi:MAG: helix-turn-helix transcriptional regulator [Clostridia bacterium]|nr:helix-turn-helix transcriptional regulator [Clostridia bacterium]
MYEALYGYKLIKYISDYIEISESTLYPILRRLESAVCLTATYTKEYIIKLHKHYRITK